MILTNCAACAAPLAHDHKKRCSRCKTRYCNEACQRDHWERGGHEALCRRIKRAGGAEQYHADKKYTEAVAVAVEACADDTMVKNTLTRSEKHTTTQTHLLVFSASKKPSRCCAK